MTLAEIRREYLDFFAAAPRSHAIIPSASLVPENDPTTLFTGSGMQPLVPYLLGQPHPAGKRVANAQKSFRAEDIDEVGDNRHTTFFEMLGNWSFGDYWKQEQLAWFFEFLIKSPSAGGVGLAPERLYVSVFSGGEGIGRDDEAIQIWEKLFAEKGFAVKYALMGTEAEGGEKGMHPEERIFGYGITKNWWSRAGVPSKMPAGEPGGPDSEVFYDFGERDENGIARHMAAFGAHCHPNCDCGRFLEIGNSVFMEYKKREDGSFEKLAQRNVDFGGGLERIAMAANGNPDMFLVNHKEILAQLEHESGKKYDGENKYAFRIIADHLKAATFLIADGVRPFRTDRGYFVRRLIRRAVRYADKIGIKENGFSKITDPVVALYGDAYPELKQQKVEIQKVISGEETRFRETLARGLNLIHKDYAAGNFNRIDGKTIFDLYATYGFPAELSLEEFGELRKKKPDDPLLQYDQNEILKEFKERIKEHQEISRAGVEQKFKGGLADHSEKTTRLHTTHHLLLKALQLVLGAQVKQRGSNITSERLRMDFNYDGKMTDEQKREVERIVNEKIVEDLPVVHSEMPRDEAERLGAEHEFGQKYPERVSVYSVGPRGATAADPRFAQAFSIEFCGGPHVTHTGEIGKFKLAKEEAVGAGIRRVRGMIE